MSKRSPSAYPASITQILTAQRDGATAAANKQSTDVCPYRPSQGQQAEFLMLMWIRGYTDMNAQIREAQRAHHDTEGPEQG